MTNSSVAQRFAASSDDRRRRATRIACLETVALIGLVTWAYSAAVAVFTPEQLPDPLAQWIPVRCDLAGIVGMAVSAVAFFAAQRSPSGTSTAVARTVCVYCGLVTVYLLGNVISHPETLDIQLTHVFPWPTERVTLMLALAGWISSFFILRLTSHGSPSTRRDRPTHES